MYSTLDLQKLVQMLDYLGFNPAIFPPHTVLLGAGHTAGPGAIGSILAGNGASNDPTFQTLAALGIQPAGTYAPLPLPANSVGTTQIAAGAVVDASVSSSSKLYNRINDLIDVKDFGATGNGSTDDTSAIQAAATFAGYGGSLYFPKGTYVVSSTITLRGATKLIGDGVSSTIIYRTGNYGDTFECGTIANTSEPARNFGAKGILFQHSSPYSAGSLPNLATQGAHLHLYGCQEAVIEDCWFWRLPYQVQCEGGSWVKVINCQFLGTYDSQTPALQEGIAQLYALPNSLYGNPTTWIVEGCNFLGSTVMRNITYPSSSGSVVINRIDTIGSQYGFLIKGLEDLDFSGNYMGGMSVAELAFNNDVNGAVLDIRVKRNFFDGISQGFGIFFNPNLANAFSFAVAIGGNVFTDQLHAIYANINSISSTPSVYNLTLTGNVMESGIGSQCLLSGVVGFTAGNNSITDYNKYSISATDNTYINAIWAFNLAANGAIQDNNIGGGGNTLLNTTGTNYCYGGIFIDPTLTTIDVQDNRYNGIRVGSTFYTGRALQENQYFHTVAGNYQMPANLFMFICRKTVGAPTAVDLPANPITGREAVIKDGLGDAGTNNITIGTSDGTTLDGSASLTINTAYGFMRFRFNGSYWNRIG